MRAHAHLSFPPVTLDEGSFGKFGVMFPERPSCLTGTPQDIADLKTISDLLKSSTNDHPFLPAGYTYLGQFLAHDISFDPTAVSERQRDPEYVHNYRTAALDLDSIYGGGPVINPYFYDPAVRSGQTNFLLVNRKVSNSPELHFDVPRMENLKKTAVIADQRNDDNVIISKIHSTFCRFHNYWADFLANKDKKYHSDPIALFYDARQMVQWYFQWIILYDYLPRIVDLSDHEDMPFKVDTRAGYVENINTIKKQINWLLKDEKNRKFFRWKEAPYIPIEFSFMAFRFGHSQVRADYQFNTDTTDLLFGKQARTSRLPFVHVDLSFFFGERKKLNFSRLIAPSITDNMANIPEAPQPPNIAYLNLFRGLQNKLPSGQELARAMKVPYTDFNERPSFLSDNKSADQFFLSLLTRLGDFPKRLLSNTPAWAYILYEAFYFQKGLRLGPVASRIIAEVIVGLIQADKTSFMYQENWVPKDHKGCPKDDFTMADLLAFLDQ